MNERIKELLSEVEREVMAVSEPFRKAAFREVLRHRLTLENQSPAPIERQPPINGKSPSTNEVRGMPDWFQEVTSGLPEPHEVANSSRDAQAVWAVIRLTAQGQEAVVEAIRKLVKDDLGLTPEDRSNLSKRLARLTPRLLQREQHSRGYKYAPTRHSLEVFRTR